METSADDPWRVSWDALAARAWAALNRYGPIPPAVLRGRSFHNYPRVRLTDEPGGFGEESIPTTLTVFELYTEAGEREPVVREAAWRQAADHDRVRAAVDRGGPAFLRPTVGERYADAPREQLSGLLREGCAFRVPVAWPSRTESITSGACGCSAYEFFTRDQPAAVLQLGWSFDPPAVWEPVVEWYARLRAFLAGCLAKVEGAAEPGVAPDRRPLKP
jgi:hypothetical protein